MKSASGSRGTGSAGRRSGRPKPACPAIKRRLKTAFLGATMNRLLVAASWQSAAGWLLPRTAALCRDAATQVHGHNARSQNRGGSFHEPESGLPAIQRLTQTRFMAPTHVRILEVFALHEPTPHPFPLPIRWGEGGRRSGEGVVHGLNACEKQKGAFLEPVGARVRRALISVVVRSGLVGVSPHRSRTQCVVARSWKLSENLPSPAPECSKNNSRCGGLLVGSCRPRGMRCGPLRRRNPTCSMTEPG